MEWNAEQIRLLRRRLGWSQSDLARRLSIEWTMVHEWEEGKCEPCLGTASHLERLLAQAELSSLEMTQITQAERALQQRDLESIKKDELASASE